MANGIGSSLYLRRSIYYLDIYQVRKLLLTSTGYTEKMPSEQVLVYSSLMLALECAVCCP